jgi:hypothetical protein
MKTARLRALRLAKEAADQEAAAMLPDRPTKTRRSKHGAQIETTIRPASALE